MSEKKRYLNIPGSDTFLHTLKFDLSPPLEPLPYGKLLYYPLDNERYTRPKLTSLNLKSIGKIFTKCDLGMPVDEINLKFFQFNPQGQQGGELDKDDQILINEIDLEQEKTQKEQIEEDERMMEEILQKQKQDLAGISDMVKTDRPHKESFSKARTTAKISETTLPQYIENTFKEAEKCKIGMVHPNREGITCKKVSDIVPQFEYLFEKLIAVNDGPGEKALPSSKDEIYLFQKEEDIDKQEILKMFRFGNARKESLYQLKEKEDEEYFDPTKNTEVYDPMKMDLEDNAGQAFDPDQEDNNNEEQKQHVEMTKIRLHKVQKLEEHHVETSALKKLENRQKYWFEHKDNFKISSNEIGGKQDFLLNFEQDRILFKRMEGNLILRKKMYGMNRPND